MDADFVKILDYVRNDNVLREVGLNLAKSKPDLFLRMVEEVAISRTTPGDSGWQDGAIALAKARERIQAVKLVRFYTGWSLAFAKAWVDTHVPRDRNYIL